MKSNERWFTYCWQTTQRVVSTFHPTRLYCFVFTPSFFVFIRHTSLSSMFILGWIQQWGVLNSKLNPGEVQLYKLLKSGTNLMKCKFYSFFCRSIQDVKFSAVVVVVVTFIKWCLLIFLPFLRINYEGKRKCQEAMKAYRWDFLLTLDLAVTI